MAARGDRRTLPVFVLLFVVIVIGTVGMARPPHDPDHNEADRDACEAWWQMATRISRRQPYDLATEVAAARTVAERGMDPAIRDALSYVGGAYRTGDPSAFMRSMSSVFAACQWLRAVP
jgi:hypothetical protein